MSDEREARRKCKRGVVISNKMDKTVVVRLERTVHHPVFKKAFRRNSKVYAHDASDALQVGDQVLIMETRPLSKLKRWTVVERVQGSEGGEGQLVAAEMAAETKPAKAPAAKKAASKETAVAGEPKKAAVRATKAKAAKSQAIKPGAGSK
jgi:small subunit ribosomal protein S17